MRPRPRRAGLLLHPTSLPGGCGVGDLGPAAHDFAAWLAASGATIWQVLPVSPTGGDGSPYGSWSTFAGNPVLISLDDLLDMGVLRPAELAEAPPNTDRVDYRAAFAFKLPLLQRAARRLLTDREAAAAIDAFGRDRPWLRDHVRFVAARAATEGLDPGFAARCEAAVQWLFDRQWDALHRRCGALGVRLLGDVPIYVARDSVAVASSPELFALDARGRPTAVAGVPPDAFSETGQRWGNPLYDWDRSSEALTRWWVARMRRAFELADIVRIDHFRGLAAYWAIPAGDEDAPGGRWLPGPGAALFEAFTGELGELDLVAEDLGLIDAPVRALKRAVGLPGMSVLHFAFGGGNDHGYLPHNHVVRSVVYTGTHDNDTTLGWWRSSPERIRDHVRRYFGIDAHDIVWDLVRACLASVAERAIVPVQDLLALGSEARMNTPSVAVGNWAWRLRSGELDGFTRSRFRGLCKLYGRLP